MKTKVEPTLQEAPGVYNDTILAGLDYLLMEMGKRKMVAVLYLNNSWEWSGFANPKHEQWQVGDDYTGDPAQEAQGLNSVFLPINLHLMW